MSRSSSSKDITPKWVHFIGGGTGGCMGALLTCPLEVVKTRFQALHNRRAMQAAVKPRYMPSFVYAFSVIIEKEGVQGLWKGLGPNLVGVFPSRAIYFGVYNATKGQMLTHGYSDNSLVHLLSAMAAGAAVSTATSPIWLVKTRMQLQTSDVTTPGQTNYKNSFDCANRVYKEEGIRGFYKGLGASYLGIAESSIQFVLYEKMKSILLERKKEDFAQSTLLAISAPPPSLSNLEYMSLAATAKLIAAVSTYPHEVLRTRLREQRVATLESPHKYTGLFQAMRLIFREEGVAGLYGGMSAHLLRVVPNAAIMFWTYELVVKYLS